MRPGILVLINDTDFEITGGVSFWEFVSESLVDEQFKGLLLILCF